MKKYILAIGLISLLGFAPQAFAAIALNSTSTATDQGGTGYTSFTTGPINVASGSLIVFFCRAGVTPDMMNASDTAGNAFVKATSSFQGSLGRADYFYVQNAIANAADTIGCNATSTFTFPEIDALDYTGIATTNALDVINATTTGSNSVGGATSPAFTTASSSEVIVPIFTNNQGTGGFSAGSGYAIRINGSAAAVEDQTVSSIQSGVTANGSGPTGLYTIEVGTFRAAPTAAPSSSAKTDALFFGGD